MRLVWVQQQVALCTLTAPVAGTVVYWRPNVGGEPISVIREGGRVTAHTPILSVADATKLQVRVRVSQAQAALLKAGQSARIITDAPAQRELEASILLVGDRPASVSSLARAEGVRRAPPIRSAARRPPRRTAGQGADPGARLSRRAPTRTELQVDAAFDALDKNGDGRLDPSEVPSLWENLKRFDTNGDGFIDREEWKKMYESLGPAAKP